MRLEWGGPIGKFLLFCQVWENSMLQPIKGRKFDKSSGAWLIPPTKAALKILVPSCSISDLAKKKVDEIMTGALVYERGSLPDGWEFITQPYPHQLEPLLRMRTKSTYALLMDPGTGKSKVLIDDSVVLWKQTLIDFVLVVCPNSITSNWVDEIKIHAGEQNVMVYDPSKKALAAQYISRAGYGLQWFVMGVEGFSNGDAWDVAKRALSGHTASLILDESSRIKNHKALRTGRLIELSVLAKYRRIATGTCITRGIEQAWPQYEFLNPNIFGMSYYSFRNMYCVMGGFKCKKIVAHKNREDFVDTIAPYTFTATKEECLNLPEKVYQTRVVSASKEQQQIYRAVKTDKSIQNVSITCLNVLVKHLRLQQICGGFVTEDAAETEDGEFVLGQTKAMPKPIGGANPKLEELMAFTGEISGKAIVWARFLSEIQAISEALINEYGEESVVQFHGGVQPQDRAEARERFQKDPACRFFVGQISCGGIGITLTAATAVIYFSNCWALEDRIQSEDRAHRIGQKNSVLYVDLVVRGTIDEDILNTLKSGKSYTEDIMRQIELATS